MVMMWSAPATDSMLATSLADMGARLWGPESRHEVRGYRQANTHTVWLFYPLFFLNCCRSCFWSTSFVLRGLLLRMSHCQASKLVVSDFTKAQPPYLRWITPQESTVWIQTVRRWAAQLVDKTLHYLETTPAWLHFQETLKHFKLKEQRTGPHLIKPHTIKQNLKNKSWIQIWAPSVSPKCCCTF